MQTLGLCHLHFGKCAFQLSLSFLLCKDHGSAELICDTCLCYPPILGILLAVKVRFPHTFLCSFSPFVSLIVVFLYSWDI